MSARRQIWNEITGAEQHLAAAKEKLFYEEPEKDTPPPVDDTPPPVEDDPPPVDPVDPPPATIYGPTLNLGPIEVIEPDWRTPDKGDGYTVELWKTPRREFKNCRILAGTRCGLIGTTNDKLIGRLLLERCEVTPAWPDLGARWGDRLINIDELIIRACHYHGIEEEHGTYATLLGDALIEDNLFEGIGSQAMQLVDDSDGERSSTPTLPVREGYVQILRNTIRNMGGGTRPSFPITMFFLGSATAQKDVSVIGNHCKVQYPEPLHNSGKDIRSTGFMIMLASQPGQNEYRNVEVRDNVVDLTDTGHPFMKINSVENGEFTGNALYGTVTGDPRHFFHRVELDPTDTQTAKRSKRILWQGNEGNIALCYEGRHIGRVDEDFEIIDGNVRKL